MPKSPPNKNDKADKQDLNRLNYTPSDDENTVMQERNFQGVVNIWDNPPSWPTRLYKYPTSGQQIITPIRTPKQPGDVILQSDCNSFAGDVKSLGQRLDSWIPPSGWATIPTPLSENPSLSQESHMQTVYNVLNNIISLLNSKDSWWDSNDYCARSCQVACQVGCQVSCQGCNIWQCHDQKCGVH